MAIHQLNKRPRLARPFRCDAADQAAPDFTDFGVRVLTAADFTAVALRPSLAVLASWARRSARSRVVFSRSANARCSYSAIAISPSIFWRSFLNSRAAACSGVMGILRQKKSYARHRSAADEPRYRGMHN